MTPQNTEKIVRYVTVSLKPATHAMLLTLLRPRETMDELINRLYEGYNAWGQSRYLEHYEESCK